MLFRSIVAVFILSVATAQNALAEGRDLSLYGADPLVESGFIQFLLPRFSLKTGIRIDVQKDRGGAQVVFASDPAGRPVMEGLGARFSLVLSGGSSPRHENAQRFADWIFSDIGQRTIQQFNRDGVQVFTIAAVTKAVEQVAGFDGDAARGARLSLKNCGRCHVVSDQNLMMGIGSTPSFALLRGLEDWRERFETFHLRRPHPAFTQIVDVTEPFDPAHPPPIHPLFLTSEIMEDIYTYVSGIEPADLGADLIIHQ